MVIVLIVKSATGRGGGCVLKISVSLFQFKQFNLGSLK